MKTSRRIFSVLLALVMMLGVLGTAMISTAAAENDTITITLTGKDLGIEKSVNALELTYTPAGEATVEIVNVDVEDPFDDDFTSLEGAVPTIVLTLKVTGDAGKTADLAISGTASVFDGAAFVEDIVVSATLTLAVDDVAAYNAAVAAAAALNERDYTAESWAALETALNATVGKDVAAATKAITDATAALAKDIDLGTLNAAIAAAEALTADEYTTESWAALTTALEAAKAALTADDQAAVTAAADALYQAIAGLKAPVVVLPETDTEPTETTPVEEPSWQSPIWPVLFAIFLALTVALTVLIVVYLILKKKKEGDDTPVVDYNIEDDEAELTEGAEDDADALDEADAETAEDEVFADDETEAVAEDVADETAEETIEETAEETAEVAEEVAEVADEEPQTDAE